MHLGEGAVVQCSNGRHTLLQPVGVIMERLPTLVILADHGFKQSNWSQQIASNSGATTSSTEVPLGRRFNSLIECALPITLIASHHFASLIDNFLPRNSILSIDTDSAIKEPYQLAKAISAGVSHSADSPGWLILPLQTRASPETVKNIASKLRDQSTVYPVYQHTGGFPIGFPSELFSELIQLKTNKDLNRLLIRYPSTSVEVNDSGVISHLIDYSGKQTAKT